jgi:hypothetical protein
MNWIKSEEWTIHKDTFSVVVKRLELEVYTGRGKNVWEINTYLYPEHKMIKDKTDLSEDSFVLPLQEMRNHFRINTYNNKIVSVEIGYTYGYDIKYNYYNTKEEAEVIFRQAEQLIEWLSNYDNKN